jgi:hypothetical protein
LVRQFSQNPNVLLRTRVYRDLLAEQMGAPVFMVHRLKDGAELDGELEAGEGEFDTIVLMPEGNRPSIKKKEMSAIQQGRLVLYRSEIEVNAFGNHFRCEPLDAQLVSVFASSRRRTEGEEGVIQELPEEALFIVGSAVPAIDMEYYLMGNEGFTIDALTAKATMAAVKDLRERLNDGPVRSVRVGNKEIVSPREIAQAFVKRRLLGRVDELYLKPNTAEVQNYREVLNFEIGRWWRNNLFRRKLGRIGVHTEEAAVMWLADSIARNALGCIFEDESAGILTQYEDVQRQMVALELSKPDTINQFRKGIFFRLAKLSEDTGFVFDALSHFELNAAHVQLRLVTTRNKKSQ